MHGREYYHETVIKDIIDLIDGVKNLDVASFGNNKKHSFKSITAATKDLILTFPIIVSTDINPNTALMFAKAHEKKCASLLQILFTAISVGSNEDVYDFVRQYHVNLKSSNASLEDYSDALDALSSKFEGTDYTYTVSKEAFDAVMQDLKESNYVLPENLKKHSLESYKIIPGYGTGYSDMIIKEEDDMEEDSNISSSDAMVNNKTGVQTNTDWSVKDSSYSNNDYKKANDLQPTLMTVNFVVKDDSGKIQQTQQCVIGIKTKIYAVPSDEICDRLIQKLADKRFLTNFVKATTNEIAFFKDFLFAIDTAKKDAISYSMKNTSNKMWKVLERRSGKSKFRRALRMTNDATAITTLVISNNDIDYMRKMYNIDLTNVAQARKILEYYNFMGICIVDESIEVCNIIYDTGDDAYETISFSGLQKESSDDYKKVINLMAKLK